MLLVKGFTLFESLLVLFSTTTLILMLSLTIRSSFADVEEQMFFREFEYTYLESQKLSLTEQRSTELQIRNSGIVTPLDTIKLPESVEVENEQVIQFDKAGGNSSLAKIVFKTRKKTVTYQLYIGNGKFKKTES